MRVKMATRWLLLVCGRFFISTRLELVVDKFELALNSVEFGVGKIFDIDELSTSTSASLNKLVELKLHSFRVSVLRVLDREHHEECHDGGRRVNDELPCVREIKEWT